MTCGKSLKMRKQTWPTPKARPRFGRRLFLFQALKNDFHYNLGLLDERDQDLERYEQLLQDASIASAEKEELLSQMRSELIQLQSELNIQRARTSEAETMCKMHRLEVAETVENDRLQREETMRLQWEEGEAQRRKMQRALAEAEDELVRQRREMTQSFTDHTRLLEAEYTAKADDALAVADTAKAFADARGHDIELLQERVELLETKLTERDEENHKLRLDLRDANRQMEHKLGQVKAEKEAATVRLENALADSTAEKETNFKELQQARKQVEVSRMELCEAKSLHAQELELRQQALSEYAEKAQTLQTELSTCQAALQITRKDMEEKLTLSSAEIHSQRAAYENASRVAQEKCEAEAAQLKQSIWEHTAELASMRSKVESLQNVLEERRADITKYRDEMQASARREDELKRQLIQAKLQLDQVATAREHTEEFQHEELVQSLAKQRDDANAHCQDLEQEVERLRHQLQSHHGRACDQASPKHASTSYNNREKISRLRVSITEPASVLDQRSQHAHQAGSTSTRPEMGSELASPSTIASIPPSPDYAQLQQVNNAPAVQPSDADAAKRKAEGSRRYSQVTDSLEKLIRGGQGEVDIVRTSVDSLAESETMEMENHRLRMAVIELEAQQERLKCTISIMREEMEKQMNQIAKQASAGEGAAQQQITKREQQQDIEHAPQSSATTLDGTGQATLQRQLTRCQLEIARLTGENERLMEVGNELRAERNMAAQSREQYSLCGWQRDQAQQAWTRVPYYDHSDDQLSGRVEHVHHPPRSVSAPARPTLSLEHDLSTGQPGGVTRAGMDIQRETRRDAISDIIIGGNEALQPWGSPGASPAKATQTYRTMVSGKASARELPSQKAKLAKLKRRHVEASQRPKTRNYNQQDY
eukprot:jgi/Tetstr1/457736/TSEL_044281.t2